MDEESLEIERRMVAYLRDDRNFENLFEEAFYDDLEDQNVVNGRFDEVEHVAGVNGHFGVDAVANDTVANGHFDDVEHVASVNGHFANVDAVANDTVANGHFGVDTVANDVVANGHFDEAENTANVNGPSEGSKNVANAIANNAIASGHLGVENFSNVNGPFEGFEDGANAYSPGPMIDTGAYGMQPQGVIESMGFKFPNPNISNNHGSMPYPQPKIGGQVDGGDSPPNKTETTRGRTQVPASAPTNGVQIVLGMTFPPKPSSASSAGGFTTPPHQTSPQAGPSTPPAYASPYGGPSSYGNATYNSPYGGSSNYTFGDTASATGEEMSSQHPSMNGPAGMQFDPRPRNSTTHNSPYNHSDYTISVTRQNAPATGEEMSGQHPSMNGPAGMQFNPRQSINTTTEAVDAMRAGHNVLSSNADTIGEAAFTDCTPTGDEDPANPEDLDPISAATYVNMAESLGFAPNTAMAQGMINTMKGWVAESIYIDVKKMPSAAAVMERLNNSPAHIAARKDLVEFQDLVKAGKEAEAQIFLERMVGMLHGEDAMAIYVEWARMGREAKDRLGPNFVPLPKSNMPSAPVCPIDPKDKSPGAMRTRDAHIDNFRMFHQMKDAQTWLMREAAAAYAQAQAFHRVTEPGEIIQIPSMPPHLRGDFSVAPAAPGPAIAPASGRKRKSPGGAVVVTEGGSPVKKRAAPKKKASPSSSPAVGSPAVPSAFGLEGAVRELTQELRKVQAQVMILQGEVALLKATK